MIEPPAPKRTKKTVQAAIYVHPSTFMRLREMAIGHRRTFKEECSEIIDSAWKKWKRTDEGRAVRETLTQLENGQ